MQLCDIFEVHEGGFVCVWVARLYIPESMLIYAGERCQEACYAVTEEGFDYLRNYLRLDRRTYDDFRYDYEVILSRGEDNDNIIKRLTNQLENLTKC